MKSYGSGFRIVICAISLVVAVLHFSSCAGKVRGEAQPTIGTESEISQKRPDVETRWASFENPLAQKGAGATENKGFKGHPFDSLEGGETKTLLQVNGSGEIRRMWFTLDSQDPEALRSLRLPNLLG
jgi:hypothetical protein